jgi:parallel beta-helix repeat protein
MMTKLTIYDTRNITLGILLAILIAMPLMPAHAESEIHDSGDHEVNAHDDHEIHVPADYSTIQTAINAANAGDDIIISSGTYTEQITINKSLDIRGSDGTILQAPPTLVADPFGATNVIDITNGATVTISKLTVSGPGPTNCGSITSGIFVSGDATLKITKSTITDIRDNPAGGCQNGVGIFVGRHAYGTTGHADIKDVKITKYQKGGIVVDNTGSTAEIQDNQISWELSPLNIASNGIQVSRGANAVVSDNTISGNICSAPSCGPDLLNNDQSTGILLFQSGGGAVVKNNNLSNNDIGIAVFASPSSIKINDNKVSLSSNVAGIILQDGTYKISNNKVTGSGNVGIGIIADSVNTFATLEDNKISGVTTTISTIPVSPYTATFIIK